MIPDDPSPAPQGNSSTPAEHPDIPITLDDCRIESLPRKAVPHRSFASVIPWLLLPLILVLLVDWCELPIPFLRRLHAGELYLLVFIVLTIVAPFVYIMHQGIDYGALRRAVGRRRFGLRAMFLFVTVVALDLCLIRWFAWDLSPAEKLMMFLVGIFYAGAMIGFVCVLVDEVKPNWRRRN